MKKIDMSEQAVLRRLRTVDQLRTLCLSLMKAKKESDVKKIRIEGDADRRRRKSSEKL